MITRITASDYEPQFESGEIILIDKQLRKSSFDIVYKVRKATGVKKVGHAGTLDPMATGLVIVCTGRKTKEITQLLTVEKTYTGIISVGKTTPSYDLETFYDTEKGYEGVTEEMIYKVSKEFLGEQLQTPPMFSAVKKEGKALYHMARKGIEVEREPKKIFISKFGITKIDLPNIHFEITCSKGTYIRVIANDFGQKLGCGAFLRELRRTKVGEYNVEDSLTIDEFKEHYTIIHVAVE
ncbi:MAG: tRNA pseudouridine synthase B [Ignavibacteria bacterium]|nr:MAG: tRNA pseudouridine synthase B [Ignavibacteria bacterium]KAF0161454.1 MAG: tRNA pseudouridine synthase B [Ignavibacteria bacterium]